MKYLPGEGDTKISTKQRKYKKSTYTICNITPPTKTKNFYSEILCFYIFFYVIFKRLMLCFSTINKEAKMNNSFRPHVHNSLLKSKQKVHSKSSCDTILG